MFCYLTDYNERNAIFIRTNCTFYFMKEPLGVWDQEITWIQFFYKCVFLEFIFCSYSVVWMFIYTKDKSSFHYLALKCAHGQHCQPFLCVFQTMIHLEILSHFAKITAPTVCFLLFQLSRNWVFCQYEFYSICFKTKAPCFCPYVLCCKLNLKIHTWKYWQLYAIITNHGVWWTWILKNLSFKMNFRIPFSSRELITSLVV